MDYIQTWRRVALSILALVTFQVLWSWPRGPLEDRLYLPTVPTGATIWVYEASGPLQGLTWERLAVRSPGPLPYSTADDRRYTFRLELPGFETDSVVTSTQTLRDPSFQIRLKPKIPVLVPLLYFIRDYAFLVLAVLVATWFGLFVVRPERHRQQRLSRLLRLEELTEGAELGGYLLEREIGGGGMARVFRARRVSDLKGELLALKALRSSLADGPRGRELLAREVNLCRRLSHPNIVHLVDWLEHESFLFLVYEFVDGKTLDQIPSPGEAEVIRWAGQLVGALAHAHSLGVIHRDIKLANLMVDGRGDIKLLDFGIGVKQAQDGQWSTTGTLETAGTVGFMSPDQLEGNNSPASDYYALGVTIYRLLTGRMPFEGSDTLEILAKQARLDYPRVSALVPGLSEPWDAFLAQLLDPNPETRLCCPSTIRQTLQECEQQRG